MRNMIQKILIITAAFLLLPFSAFAVYPVAGRIKFLKTVFFFALFLILSNLYIISPAIGAPDNLNMANNVIQHGQSVTVTGTSFGTKISGNAAPIRYDDFETGTVGHDVTTDFPWWSKSSNTPSILIDSTKPRGGGMKAINQYLRGGTDSNDAGVAVSILMKNNIGFATTGKILLSYWEYFDWGTFYQSGGQQVNYLQIKSTALAPGLTNTGGVTPANSSYLGYFNYVYGLDATPYYHTYLQPYYTDATNLNVYSSGTTFANDTTHPAGWRHIMMQINQGTAGGYDGSKTVYDSRYDFGGAYYKNSATSVQVLSGGSSPLDAIKLGWYRHYSNYGESNIWHDDIYIDNSWARVEIGDQSTYDACTHREIQIPSAWSDTSITFTANRGSFNDGNAYLYITDENGVQNAACYPITLTSNADLTAPASPNGLSVM